MDGTETGWGRPAEPAPRWRALLDRARHASRTAEETHGADRDEHDEPQRPTSGAAPLPGRPVSPPDRRPLPPLDPRHPLDQRQSEPPRPGPEPRPVNPFDRRPVNPLDRRVGRTVDPRPVSPAEPRPMNPLDSRRQALRAEGFPGRQDGFGARGDGAPGQIDRPGGTNGFPGRAPGHPPRPDSPPRPDGPVRPDGPARPDGPVRPDGPAPRPGGFAAQPDPVAGRSAGFAGRADGLRGRVDGLPGRAESEQPHSFFNPATRAVPPPIARVTPENGYPAARAAAAVGPASVLPPPAPAAAPPAAAPPAAAPPAAAPPAAAPPAPAAPTSPAPARIEWRQARSDQDLDRAVAVMRRKLGTPRVLAFANPKGGVHKTTATVLAAATIGSVRGRGVLAWDDNELRGTLGLRAGSARHARTIRHLVADLLRIENMHGDELLGELDDYLRHASDGSYDVLAGEENPRFAQRLDQHTVRRVMDLLRRTHDVICVDTGNNVESVNWQTVMKAADQLVITTVPREDAAFTADWMLDLLDDTGMGDIVANAVTLISCPSPGKLPLLDDLTKHFATRTRAVAVVPYDPALEVGSSIEYADLQPETRAAWLRAASVMIEPFAQ
ncbi:MinD/ParA family protein [Krasilnikovia sp. M28-CT-15]|uniref:MinD/ParA family protein n=1 Tax=Krasilnikovia sp. M28-CT-15 TaxID=3373540 RepID=UPI003876CD95